MPLCSCFPRKKAWAFIRSTHPGVNPQYLYNDETTIWLKTRRKGDISISTKCFPLSMCGQNKQVLRIKRGNDGGISTTITKIEDDCRVSVDSKTLEIQNAIRVHNRKVKIIVNGLVVQLIHCKQLFEAYIPDEVLDRYDAVEKVTITKFGKLYKVKKKSADIYNVIKVAHNDPKGVAQNLLQKEIDILKRLSHENIITFVSARLDPLHLTVEYASGGNLMEYILKNGPLVEREAKVVFEQILSALCFLHDNMISHRDVKPDNIVLMKKNSLHQVKLIDFDVSSYIPPNGGMISGVGTLPFMSPILMDNYIHNCDFVYTEKTDIWSFGVSLYFAITKKFPYNQGFDKLRYWLTEKKGKVKLDCSRFNNLSLFAQNVIRGCLQLKEGNRPSASDLQDSYHWFTSNRT